MNVRDRRVHRFRSSNDLDLVNYALHIFGNLAPRLRLIQPLTLATERWNLLSADRFRVTRAGFRGRDAAGYPPFLDPKKMISSKNNRRNLPRKKELFELETLLTFDSARLGKRQSYATKRII